MAENNTVAKLDNTLKMKVLALIARGEKNKEIKRVLLEQHGITYSDASLSNLRNRNAETIAQMEHMILDAEVAETEKIRSKSLRMLSRKLDRATNDERELMELDEKYRLGQIDLATYKRQKTGLLNVSIKELTLISEKMHEQSKEGPGANPGELPGGTNLDGHFLEAVMAAVKNGDTITLMKLTLTPRENTQLNPPQV